MAARTKLAPEDQMTIEEFLAFTDTRPDEERWELIEGEPVMSPSPVWPTSTCGPLLPEANSE